MGLCIIYQVAELLVLLSADLNSLQNILEFYIKMTVASFVSAQFSYK